MQMLETWAGGFCRARGFPMPEAMPEGLWLDMGLRQQSGRYWVRELAGVKAALLTVDRPATYVEVAASGEALKAYLPSGWDLKAAGVLMRRRLGTIPLPTVVPKGCSLTVGTNAGIHSVEIRTEDGEPVATGLCIVSGNVAIFDEILTREGYRRHGLGRAVVEALEMEAGGHADEGLLLATQQGQRLYERLGWSVVSEVTAMVSPSQPRWC